MFSVFFVQPLYDSAALGELWSVLVWLNDSIKVTDGLCK